MGSLAALDGPDPLVSVDSQVRLDRLEHRDSPDRLDVLALLESVVTRVVQVFRGSEVSMANLVSQGLKVQRAVLDHKETLDYRDHEDRMVL